MKARFKPKYNIKKGDQVIVISGAAKPRKDDSGKLVYKPKAVKEVILSENGAKVIVEGVNMVTKHSKPSAQNTKGGIIRKEAPIHISNVMLWDATAKSPSKIKRVRENGKSVRILKKSGNKL
jgi:large subunit ribosomal protein L24